MNADQIKQIVSLLSRTLGSPLLLGVAAMVAFIGSPTPADLLGPLGLLDVLTYTSNQLVLRTAPLIANSTQIVLIVAALGGSAISLFLQLVLIAWSHNLLQGQPINLMRGVKSAWGSLWNATYAAGLVALVIFILTLLAWFIASYFLPAKGLNLFTSGTVLFLLTLFLVWLGLAVRAIVFDYSAARAAQDPEGYEDTKREYLTPHTFREVKVRRGVYGEFDRMIDLGLAVIKSRPQLTLLVFLISLTLDVLKGPVAAIAGAFTNGWLLILGLGQQFDSLTLIYSLLALTFATIVIAFQAVLWTWLYLENSRAPQR